MNYSTEFQLVFQKNFLKVLKGIQDTDKYYSVLFTSTGKGRMNIMIRIESGVITEIPAPNARPCAINL